MFNIFCCYSADSLRHSEKCCELRAYSHKVKADAKAKKYRRTIQKDQRISYKHHIRNSLSLLLSLGVSETNGLITLHSTGTVTLNRNSSNGA